MDNKLIIVFGIFVLVVGLVVAGVILVSGEDAPEPETYDTTDTSELVADPITFTVAEIQSHNTAADCWTVITGNVYDITNYISAHPGGDEVLRACGADGTTLFAARTTNDGEEIGSGTSHSSAAFETLDQFYIGTVAPTP